MRTLRAIDLFTGAGGLTLGFHKAMEDLGIDFKVVASVELDKDSAKTYAKISALITSTLEILVFGFKVTKSLKRI